MEGRTNEERVVVSERDGGVDEGHEREIKRGRKKEGEKKKRVCIKENKSCGHLLNQRGANRVCYPLTANYAFSIFWYTTPMSPRLFSESRPSFDFPQLLPQQPQEW